MERVEEWHTRNFKTIFDDSKIQDKMSWKIFKFDRSIGWLAYGAPTERPHIKGQNDSSRWLIWAFYEKCTAREIPNPQTRILLSFYWLA